MSRRTPRNRISPAKELIACELFARGESIQGVARSLKMSSSTAKSIKDRNEQRIADLRTQVVHLPCTDGVDVVKLHGRIEQVAAAFVDRMGQAQTKPSDALNLARATKELLTARKLLVVGKPALKIADAAKPEQTAGTKPPPGIPNPFASLTG